MYHEVEILLIEDNASDAEMIIDALKMYNFGNKVFHVKDGAEGLDFIFAEGKYLERQIENKPRLILLDLKMPKVTGIEVLTKIRSDHRTKRIPVVVHTSSMEDADIEVCYNLGINSYVVKRVEFDAFQKAISEIGFYWMMVNQHPQ